MCMHWVLLIVHVCRVTVRDNDVMSCWYHSTSSRLTCQRPAPGPPSCRCGAAEWRSDGWPQQKRWWRRWAGPPTSECWSPAGAPDRPSLSVQPSDPDPERTMLREKMYSRSRCLICKQSTTRTQTKRLTRTMRGNIQQQYDSIQYQKYYCEFT